MNYVIWDNVNDEYVKSDIAGYGDEIFTFDEGVSLTNKHTTRSEALSRGVTVRGCGVLISETYSQQQQMKRGY